MLHFFQKNVNNFKIEFEYMKQVSSPYYKSIKYLFKKKIQKFQSNIIKRRKIFILPIRLGIKVLRLEFPLEM